MNTEKLYVSTIASDAYKVAKQYGIGIEIADFCTAWNMDDESEQTNKLLKSNLNGIDKRLLHAPFNELFPCAIDKKARQLAAFRYKQAALLAKEYKASKVIIHGGYNPYIYYPEWYVEQSVIFWKSFIKECPEGVHIALENTFEEAPGLLLDIIKGVDDSRLGICLDVGHVNAYSKIPVIDWIERMAGYISHFHIHNNDGTCDSHNALNQGSIPMKEVLKLSGKLCPDASYTLELINAEASARWIMD